MSTDGSGERREPDPGSGGPGFSVGFVPGVTVSKWTRIWSERLPRIPLHTLEVAEPDQRRALDDGRVDMCFVRLPISDRQLHLIPLYEEVPVVIVPRDHPVSLYDQVSRQDLADEAALDPADPADAIDLVAAGAGVLFAPQSVARSYSRRDVVYRPVSDGTPTRVALAWRVDNPTDLIEELIGIVRGRTPNSSRSNRSPDRDASSRPAPDRRAAQQPTSDRGRSSVRPVRRSRRGGPGRRGR